MKHTIDEKDLDTALELPDLSEEFLVVVKPLLEVYFDDAARLAEKLVKDILKKTEPVEMENNKLLAQLLLSGRVLGMALGYTAQHIVDYCGIQIGSVRLGAADDEIGSVMKRVFTSAMVRSLILYCKNNQLFSLKTARGLVDFFDSAFGAGNPKNNLN